MELIVEVLVSLMQVVGELLLQAFAQMLAEVFGHSVQDALRRLKPRHPAAAACLYAALGAALGAASLAIFPDSAIEATWLRVTNLLVTPVLVGLLMSAMGAWRRRRGEDLIRLDQFSYGYLFALSMAAVRFAWT